MATLARSFTVIADVRQLLNARPFRPFFVITTGGNRYRVASAEHAGISPERNRLLIWLDDGSGITVAGLHIASIEKEAELPA